MPGTARLLRVSVLLLPLSILMLGFTKTWRALIVSDAQVAVLTIVAVLPALVTFLPQAGSWLGKRHLPAAMAVYLVGQVTLSSCLHNWGLVRFDLVQLGPLHFVEPGVLLMIPALLVAWQYGWFGALVAASATGLLHLGVGLLMRALATEVAQTTAVPLLRPDLLYVLPLAVAYLGFLLRKEHRRWYSVQAQLREYVAAAELLAIDRERRWLASHLQDTLARSLANLAEQLDAIVHVLPSAPDKAASELAAVRERVQGDVQATQQVIERLRSQPLAELGFLPALRLRIQALREQGVDVEFEARGVADELTPEQEVVLYHVADEVLTHVENHAGVSRVTLQLLCLGSHVALTIHDNGLCQCGQQAQADDGLEARLAAARLIGGQLCLDRDRQRGNTVALWLPSVPPES